MLTTNELTQARALSSPEIPDDDDTAKQPTRQLVRKLLAHIDALDRRLDAAMNALDPVIDDSAKIKTELHAALDAKEKAEAETKEARYRWTVNSQRADKAEIRCAELQAENAALKDASVSTGKELNKLQAIVDRIAKQKPEKPDYWTECGQCGRNINDCEEAALSAAASSGAKEKQ
jgi:chromosome segregation ATPase